MFTAFGGNRIIVDLQMLQNRQTVLAPVEKHAKLFEGYIRNLTSVLDHSPTARAVLQHATNKGVTVGLDPLLEPHSSFFYPSQNHIDLGYQPDLLQKTEKGLSRYLVSFAGALRRVYHHYHHCSADIRLKPADFVDYFRATEADVAAVTHLIGWELRAAGLGFLWRHMLSGHDGDIAIVFERAALERPLHQFDGTALQAAFNQWYAERERINTADHFALELIDMALLDRGHAGYIGSTVLDFNDLRHIGRLPTGQNYLKECLFSSNWYRGLDDDINKTHLRHIESDISQVFEKHK